jgi:hypothetical protein
VIDRTAIDPSGCGCTDCLTGAAVPLDQATQEQLIMALFAHAALRTDEDIDIKINVMVTREDLEHPALPTHREALMRLLDAAVLMNGATLLVTPH